MTLIFDELGKTAGDFLSDVKRQRSEWVKNPNGFDTSSFIADMTNLYTNYKSTGEWDKQGADQQKVLIALATALKQERATNKQQSTDAGDGMTADANAKTGKTVIPKWKFKKVGHTTKCPITGDRFKWCPHHGRKEENEK